jgi:transposase
MKRAAWQQDRRMVKFLDVLTRWEAGSLSMSQAGELLGMSERQFRRYRDRYEEDGLEGLKDRRLGKASPKRVPASERERIVALYRETYRGWNVKHFHEHLRRDHGFRLSYTFVKLQLHTAGLVERAARRGAHRRKRERKPCAGMMLHQDGSRAAWLAGQPMLDLIVTLDDATSEIYSAFLVEEEGTASTLRALLEVFTAKGLPSSLYTDRGSHYFITAEADGPVDKLRLTQVGRALRQLGIEHIPAYSPEARGRSERMFGTLQDRLIKELAKAREDGRERPDKTREDGRERPDGARITDIAQANRWIREVYLPQHNARFAQPAAVADRGFVVPGDPAQLREILCVQGDRVVDRDNTVAWERLKLQLPESPLRHHYVKARVRVHAYPDGTLAVFHGPRCLARFTAHGALMQPPTPASVTPCSPPSRTLRAASGGGLGTAKPAAGQAQRPSLTAAARGGTPDGQVGTKKRCSSRTKKRSLKSTKTSAHTAA